MKKPVKLSLRPNRQKTASTYYLQWQHNGKRVRKSLGHSDASLAAKQLRTKIIELTGEVPDINPRRVRLSELCEAYLASTVRLESSTKELTARAFRYLIEARKDKLISRFTVDDAEKFQRHLVQGKRNEVSANIYVKAVRPVFRWAARTKRWILANPFADFQLFHEKTNRIRVYEPDEFAAILSNCPSALWQARVLLAKTAGLRAGEVLNLTRDDIDFKNGVVRISPKEESQTTWRWRVKDKEARDLPLVDEVAGLLKMISAGLPDSQPYLMLTSDRYDAILQLRQQGRLSDRVRRRPVDNFWRRWHAIMTAAGVKGTFHDLRRTCITEYLEAGLKPHEVMQLAGHSDINTTMRYYVTTRRDLIARARKAGRGSLGFEVCGRFGQNPAHAKADRQRRLTA